MKQSKIAIIGAGAVGSTTAYALMLQDLTAEIILIDVKKEHCKGEILDLSDSISFSVTSKIRGGNIEDAKNVDIIIITAGIPQKPGQIRDELINTNKRIVSAIMKDLQPINKQAKIIMVTNPLDTLTYIAQQKSGLPKSQVFGTGTFLDTQRIRGLLSNKFQIAEQSIHAYTLGEHGDTQFVAWSCATIGGIPISSFPQLTKENLKTLSEEARNKANEIIQYKGATFFGISACVAAICENIIFDQKRVLPLSVYMENFGVCLSMPSVLGKNGIEKILEIPLNTNEKKLLAMSAKKIKQTMSI